MLCPRSGSLPRSDGKTGWAGQRMPPAAEVVGSFHLRPTYCWICGRIGPCPPVHEIRRKNYYSSSRKELQIYLLKIGC